jgi:hypothetical protein
MRRGERRGLVAALLLILVLALLPVASVLLSSVVADAAGCRLDEGGFHPCVILGADWGGVLGTMFVLGWLALVTLPLGAVALAAWAVAAVLLWLKGRRGGARAKALE